MEQQMLRLLLTGGNVLFATINADESYPSININIEYACGKQDKICFVELNSQCDCGEKICTGVYSIDSDEPVYYESFFDSNVSNKAN